MNGWLLIGLGAISIWANATMDEIRFHWDRLFGKIVKPGSRLEKWMNPSISWYNKYRFKSELLNYIYGSVCVWFTDFWHLLKAIHLNLLFIIILMLYGQAPNWKYFIGGLVLLNGIWGFVFQSTFGIYGCISYFVNKWKERLKN